MQIIGVKSQENTAMIVRSSSNPYLQLSVQNYAVLFNLDVSGSMSGSKWNSVCQSVDKFVEYLGDRDLIAAMVFNNQVKLLSSISEDDELLRNMRRSTKPAITYRSSPP